MHAQTQWVCVAWSRNPPDWVNPLQTCLWAGFDPTSDKSVNQLAALNEIMTRLHQAVNLPLHPQWWECETRTALRSSLNPNMYTYLSDEREEKENKRTSNIWKSELLRWQPVPKSISDLWSNYGFGSSWNRWMMWGLGSVGLESWLPRLCHAACQPPLQLHAAFQALLSLLSVFGFRSGPRLCVHLWFKHWLPCDGIISKHFSGCS